MSHTVVIQHSVPQHRGARCVYQAEDMPTGGSLAGFYQKCGGLALTLAKLGFHRL